MQTAKVPLEFEAIQVYDLSLVTPVHVTQINYVSELTRAQMLPCWKYIATLTASHLSIIHHLISSIIMYTSSNVNSYLITIT